ncbi:MAG TPA: thermonuclease family protein [Rubrobacter sp.]
MGEAELFNRTLLEKGYAEVLTIEPNDLYAECFEAAESNARESGIGLWAEGEITGGPAAEQYDGAAPETTTEDVPPDTLPTENAPTEDPTQ